MLSTHYGTNPQRFILIFNYSGVTVNLTEESINLGLEILKDRKAGQVLKRTKKDSKKIEW